MLRKSAGGPRADSEHGETGGDGHRTVAGERNADGHGDSRGSDDSASSASRGCDHVVGLTSTGRRTADASRRIVVAVIRVAHGAAIVANGAAADGGERYGPRSGGRQIPVPGRLDFRCWTGARRSAGPTDGLPRAASRRNRPRPPLKVGRNGESVHIMGGAARL